MAEVLDEFDEATPMRNSFCSKLSVEEYEEQSAATTEEALSQLIAHLEGNPEEYKRILRAKKEDEAMETSVFSYLKVKLFSFFPGSNGFEVSEEECAEKLEKLKENMIKSYNYSQECKGKRFSKRLLEKRARKEIMKMGTPSRAQQNVHVPPPPPLPPTFSVPKKAHHRLPPACSTPIVHATLTSLSQLIGYMQRRPLSTRQVKQVDKRPTNGMDSIGDVMMQIKGSECKKRLKRVAERSPGGTPVQGWPKRHKEPDFLPYFNSKLLSKFRNVQSPLASPTMASPGSFETPLHTPTSIALSPVEEDNRMELGEPPAEIPKVVRGSVQPNDKENAEPMEM